MNNLWVISCEAVGNEARLGKTALLDLCQSRERASELWEVWCRERGASTKQKGSPHRTPFACDGDDRQVQPTSKPGNALSLTYPLDKFGPLTLRIRTFGAFSDVEHQLVVQGAHILRALEKEAKSDHAVSNTKSSRESCQVWPRSRILSGVGLATFALRGWANSIVPALPVVPW